MWRVAAFLPGRSLPRQLAGLPTRHAEEERWPAPWTATSDRLAGLDSHLPEVYLAVSLSEGRRGGGIRSLGRARRSLEEVAGVRRRVRSRAPSWRPSPRAERRTSIALAPTVDLRRATTAELQWLLRRAACRGIAEPALE